VEAPPETPLDVDDAPGVAPGGPPELAAASGPVGSTTALVALTTGRPGPAVDTGTAAAPGDEASPSAVTAPDASERAPSEGASGTELAPGMAVATGAEVVTTGVCDVGAPPRTPLAQVLGVEAPKQAHAEVGPEDAQADADAHRASRGHRPVHARKGVLWRWPVMALVVALVCAVVAVAAIRVTRPVPGLVVSRSVLAPPVVAGPVPALPWPATGEAAVAVPALGMVLQSGTEKPVPIASLTKIMTAYVVLHDRPLAPGAQGPLVTISDADEEEVDVDQAVGATYVPVQAGERLSERQLLDGLLVHSANDLADVLARWDAGSVAAFVTEMNAAAAQLGLRDSHYDDASGLDPGTVGSAGDELRLAMRAMTIPTFAAVVDQPSVTLPLAGTLQNYVSSVGSDGIVGVKSGFTQAAMGCLVLAAERQVAGTHVLVLAAVTGQPGSDPLSGADRADELLVNATGASLRTVAVVARGEPVGTVSAPWRASGVPLVTASGASVLAWPGDVAHVGYVPGRLHPGSPAGTADGALTVSLGPEHLSVPVRTEGGLWGPSMRWRLDHG